MSGRIDFVAVDVETANADLASICQIGIATIRSGKIEDVWSQLIDPEDFFDPMNVAIHGIDESKVCGAPNFETIFNEIHERLLDIVVSHTSFDRLSIIRASEKYRLQFSERIWLDSARIVRRAWPEKYAQKGYGLANVASELGIKFSHHDASEDARAAAEIVLRACSETSLDIDGWLDRVAQPISSSSSELIRREGNAEGPLFGEVVVFTGGFETSKREEADMAASAGCAVGSGVSKKTTLLVVGDRRYTRQEKSLKWRKAESLMEKGQPIRILCESDFRELISQS